jgi:hypothetical protein
VIARQGEGVDDALAGREEDVGEVGKVPGQEGELALLELLVPDDDRTLGPADEERGQGGRQFDVRALQVAGQELEVLRRCIDALLDVSRELEGEELPGGHAFVAR